jgi:putative FmdB family regulatory protein
MPMYDFECQGCGHTFEAVARSDEKLPCPECKGDNVERLISAPAIGGKAQIHFRSSHRGNGRPPRSGPGP